MTDALWLDPYPVNVYIADRNDNAKGSGTINDPWTGRHEEAIRVNDLILACPNVPENYLASARRNKQLSLEILNKTSCQIPENVIK